MSTIIDNDTGGYIQVHSQCSGVMVLHCVFGSLIGRTFWCCGATSSGRTALSKKSSNFSSIAVPLFLTVVLPHHNFDKSHSLNAF